MNPLLKINLTPERRIYFILAGITLAGLAMRLRSLGTESMTADEVSALLRLQFPSFGAMIDGGVRPDGHPAFAQVLLWCWTKCFGLSPFVVRLPFALMGAASVWLAALIAKKWFGEATALATAAGMAFLQFPLMYSQLARPYAPGLFFTLLTAYFLTQLITQEKAKRLHLIGYALAAALAAYSHYFSLLMAALLSLAGFFLVPKHNRRAFLLACAVAVLLFVPYLGIFIDQLKTGGVGGPGGWLGKPAPAFLQKHLMFAFDGSRGVMWAVLAIGLGTMIVFFKRPGKFHLVALLLWLLPLVIGYAYSVLRNPVLQDSVLLFGFPFLLMFLFAWLPAFDRSRIAPVLPLGIVLGLLLYIGSYKPYHLTDHFGRLKELVEQSLDWQQQYGVDSVTVAYNVDAPYFVNYYYDQLGKKPQHVVTTINNGDKELRAFRELVEKSSGNFFVYAWSTKYSPPEIPEIIQEFYPYAVSRRLWFNSAVYVFSKKDIGYTVPDDPLFRSWNDLNPHFPPSDAYAGIPIQWTGGCGVIEPEPAMQKDTTLLFVYVAPTDYNIRLDSSCVYSPSLEEKLGDIAPNPDNQLFLHTRVKQQQPGANIVLVIEIDRDGKQLYWNGRESATQMNAADTAWQNIYFGLQLPEDLRRSDTVKFYCYSLNGKSALIDFLEVQSKPAHTGIYGTRPDFE